MARSKKYNVKVKRKRQRLTNYKKRLKYISSGLPRIIIRPLLNNTIIQIVNYSPSGDQVLLTTSSHILKKFGWKGHNGNIPAAYLTGLLFGKKLKEKKIQKAIIDSGLHKPIRGSRFYAAIKGILESSGIEIPCSKEVLPSDETVSGKKIVDYASILAKDQKAYEKQFSNYLKNNLKPELFLQHFKETKTKILGGS